MKRSKKAVLMLMVPATTLLLASCGEEPEQAVVYSDPSECAASGQSSLQQCEADFAAAQKLHPQVAPKYLNKEECEADFGAGHCETAPQQTTSGSSVFMPMMMGYLAGQMMGRGGMGAQGFQPPANGNTNGNPGAQAGKSTIQTQPLYKSRDDRNTFRTATNNAVAQGVGPTAIKPSQVKPQVGQLVNRGGFGRQAAARSSFGG
jgi:uncharacterized protein YgiB involved in biofilm formation